MSKNKCFKILCLLLALLPVLCCLDTPAAAAEREIVLPLDSHKPFMTGTGSGLFEPERAMTRGEAAQLLYNLLEDKPAVGYSRFSDVSLSDWYGEAVNALARLGILSGTGNGRFAPARKISRSEFITMVCRCFPETAGQSSFPDVPETHWAYGYISMAAQLGWVHGDTEGSFRPDDPILRCEAAAIICAVLGRTEDDGFAAQRERQKFSDVPQNHWAYLFITEAAEPPAQLPILVYHNFSEEEPEPSDSMTVSTAQFVRELELLEAQGYTTVLVEDLIAFVDEGAPLPEKPVCITIDDGYRSVYELVFPILQERGQKANLFVIGSSVGADSYKNTEIAITPHFDYSQAKIMADSGLISLQSHTYDMHQWADFETGEQIRPNVLRQDWEDEESHTAALQADFTRSRRELETATGRPVVSLAYPYNDWDESSESILKDMGVRATFASGRQNAVLVYGGADSLYHLSRRYVLPGMSDEAFLSLLG